MLDKADYQEPVCPFDASMWTGAPSETVPVNRVTEKSDEYLSRNEFDAAEKHLKYWLDSAVAFRDIRGAFFVHNELIGFYRKTGREEEAMRQIAEAMALTEDERIGKNSTGAATLFVNAATAYVRFSHPEKAVGLFKEAQKIYERDLKEDDGRLGGLYNNMALALAETEAWEEAEAYFLKAIEVMGKVKHGETEQAVSYLNLADIQEEGSEKIEAYLDLAEALLDTPDIPQDSYYAYIIDKCAPVFSEYGRKAYAEKLMKRKEAIL